MPLTVKSGDVVFHYGFAATATFRREHIEVICAAVRFAVSFVKTVLAELLSALSAEEMLSVPGLF